MRTYSKKKFEPPSGPITVIDSTSLQMLSSAMNLPTTEQVAQSQHLNASDDVTDDSKPVTNENLSVECRHPPEKPRDLTQIPEAFLGTHYARGDQPFPEFENWPGKCEFNLDIPQARLNAEGLPNESVVYSLNRNKLYVKKDQPFKINFFTSTAVPSGSKIRAMGMYIQQEFAAEIVKRCDRHTINDYQMNVEAPDHLIRCECQQASYDRDPVSNRHSLVVPYKTSLIVPNCCSYLYKFVCNGGCYGGLNQRRFRVIFTLENCDIVIGRRSFEVKICGDPQKDCERDDKRAALLQEQAERKMEPSKGKKRLAENSNLLDVLEWINKFKSSSDLRSDEEENNTGSFWQIEVPDQEAYELLVYARQAYRLMKALEKYSPYIAQYLTTLQKRKRRK